MLKIINDRLRFWSGQSCFWTWDAIFSASYQMEIKSLRKNLMTDIQHKPGASLLSANLSTETTPRIVETTGGNKLLSEPHFWNIFSLLLKKDKCADSVVFVLSSYIDLSSRSLQSCIVCPTLHFLTLLVMSFLWNSSVGLLFASSQKTFLRWHSSITEQ